MVVSEPKIEWLEGSPTAKHTRRQNDVAFGAPASLQDQERYGEGSTKFRRMLYRLRFEDGRWQ